MEQLYLGDFLNSYILILLWNLTWNLKMEVWKIIFLFSWVFFRLHVKFQGCTNCAYTWKAKENLIFKAIVAGLWVSRCLKIGHVAFQVYIYTTWDDPTPVILQQGWPPCHSNTVRHTPPCRWAPYRAQHQILRLVFTMQKGVGICWRIIPCRSSS